MPLYKIKNWAQSQKNLKVDSLSILRMYLRGCITACYSILFFLTTPEITNTVAQ